MRVVVIGCGVIGGLLARHLAEQHVVCVHDHAASKTKALAQIESIKVVKDLPCELEKADLIILAVKPQSLSNTAEEIARHLSEKQVLVSVLVGVTIEVLRQCFPGPKILRMMPNIAMKVGKGVIGLALSEEYSADDRDDFTELFAGLGMVQWLPETLMEALAAIAGSGPAFMMLILEAMVEAGIAMGLTASTALALSAQTMKGAVALVEHGEEPPAACKWKVCSPGGSTIAGVIAMEDSGVRSGVMQGILTTYDRSLEIQEEA